MVSLVETEPKFVDRRVQYPPSYNDKGYSFLNKPKRFPIANMVDLREQEAVIIKDLLSVLCGLEGFYIRYSESFKQNDILMRLNGPDYNVDKHLDAGLKDKTKKLSKIGKVYYGLEAFATLYDDIEYGQTMQALCCAIRRLLKEFNQYVVHVEFQFNRNPSYSISNLETDLAESIAAQLFHVYDITKKINKENLRRADRATLEDMRFSNVMRDLRSEAHLGSMNSIPSESRNSRFVKGVTVLRLIQISLDENRGDASSFNFLLSLFNSVSRDFVIMLNNWLESGQIDDPYDEFIINQEHSNDLYVSMSEAFWNERFRLKNEVVLKQFDSKYIQQRLLLTGKYLNLIVSCGLHIDHSKHPYSKIDTVQDNSLILKIDEAYKRANKLVIQLIFKSYSLGQFLKVLNKYFLLTQNSEFDSFLDLLISHREKSKHQLSIHLLVNDYYQKSYTNKNVIRNIKPSRINIQSLITHLIDVSLSKTSIFHEISQLLNTTTTNAEQILAANNFENLENVLQETRQSMYNSSRPNSNGAEEENTTSHYIMKIDKNPISRLSIDVEVPFPLNLVISKTYMKEYQYIFRNLAIVKFLDNSLKISSKEIKSDKCWTYKFKNPKITKFITASHLLHNKMMNFVKIYLDYINFTVIERRWQDFKIDLEILETENDEKFANDDQFNEFQYLSHSLSSFLSSIINESLMSKFELYEAVYDLFSFILTYHQFTMSLKKRLAILDIDLFESVAEQLALGPEFDFGDVDNKLKKLIKVQGDYSQVFLDKLENLLEALKYYGDVETTSFLSLYNSLSYCFFPGREI